MGIPLSFLIFAAALSLPSSERQASILEHSRPQHRPLAVLRLDEKKEKGDLAKLQGEWKSGTRVGTSITLKITGSRFSASFVNENQQQVTVEGKLRLDETSNPRRLDWVETSVVASGDEVPDLLGIYEIEGETLRFCRSTDVRPEHFDSRTLIFSRSKSKKAR